MAISPGEIYFADIGAADPHRVVVVSREEFNVQYATIVPLTSQRFEQRRHYPTCVPFLAGEFGCTLNCVAQATQISMIRVQDIHVPDGPIATLDDIAFRSLIKAIGHVICADCEPE